MPAEPLGPRALWRRWQDGPARLDLPAAGADERSTPSPRSVRATRPAGCLRQWAGRRMNKEPESIQGYALLVVKPVVVNAQRTA